MVVQDKPNYRDIPQGETGSNDRKQQRLRERFEVVKKLGQGTYGKVQLAINKETKQEVAIKTIKKAKIENEQDLVRIRREIQIMSSIHHPHIIHIYEVFENQEKIVLIMQYASGGELYDYLGCRKKLDENEARRVFRQVASAIFYCHKNHICHRDLKLENILLDDRGNAKIADFGLSNVFDQRFKLKTFCGSPLYASPEIVRGTPYCGPEVDCWSLGVLLYTLVYGAMPFDGGNFKRLVKQISEGEYFEPKEKSGASGLIRRLLTVDISLRATIRDICSDWWVNQGYDHSLLKIASDMANLAPVRLDLLLALSSTTSQTAGRPVKNQATIAIEPAENRSILSNGYYSKSHPVRAPENGESRRRALAIADVSRANNSNSAKEIEKLQALVGASQNAVNDHMEEPGHLPIVDDMKTSVVQTPSGDKNESNTLIIVQDLIKDVISKVEQHINISKMELLRNTNTKFVQEKFFIDQRRNNNSPLKGKGMVDSPEESPRVITPVEIEKAYQNTLPDSRPSVINSVGPNAFIQTTKIQGVSDELCEKYFPDKTAQVQVDTSNYRRKSIPGKNCDVPSRKSSVQMMEPDFVIPIFNVYSNIPKRSLDAVKSPPTKPKPKLANSELLPENEGKDISNSSSSGSNQVSNTRDRDLLCKFKSQLPNGLDETLQRKISASNSESSNAAVGTQEHSEVPKLPPRKRLLIKIPQMETSNGKDVPIQSESEDIECSKVCDKHEALRGEELEHQKAGKDFGYTSPTDDKKGSLSVASEEDALLTATKEGNTESSPKLPQRKSRRDSSKRCLSFNSKSGMNQQQSHFIPEKQNWIRNKREDPETVPNISAIELSGRDLDVKHNEMNEIFKDESHLLQSPAEHAIMLTLDANTPSENKSIQLEKCPKVGTEEIRTEILETKIQNTDLSQNSDLLEEEKSFRNEANETQNMKSCNFTDVKDILEYLQQTDGESRRSRPLVRSKHRSLSRTRAMSLEFESLALMPMKTSGPPKKPPGKVEIPKNFDPTQVVTSPKAEMREIIFVPTACVSENKEKIQKKIEMIVTSPRSELREIIFIPAACVSENKEIIQKKIEKVKKAAIVIPPRRKSDAGISSKKKKYTRSKTDFIVRPDDLATFAEDANLVMEDGQQDVMCREIDVKSGEVSVAENMDGEAVSNEIWYSAISPDNESEESEQRFKTFRECADSYEGLYNDNDVTDNENRKLHRHSVDAESGYWTPPDMTGEHSISEGTMKVKGEKHPRKSDNYEKVMLQRAAFRNSKMRMKLSDEGLDMCSLSSSLESGIYSWRQEEMNGKRVSPDSESAFKVLSPMKFAEMALEGNYPPIARSFKKMTFPPEHSSTSELSENCSVVGDTDKILNIDVGTPRKEKHISPRVKVNGDTKPIKPSDSQSSYGSNDISDEVFESWAEKEDVVRPSNNDSSEGTENRGTLKAKTNNSQGEKARNWKRGEAWQSFSTDKESSDNDDDLDLMIDEACQGVYGTEGLWQFLKSVNQNLSNELKSASKKMSPKLLCHRSKSQETKHPDDVVNQKRPVTRSLSREEKQRKGGTQLRHFVSEGKLADADSMDCFEDSYSRYDDTRYSSGYMASGSSLDDSGMQQKDFMSSVDSFNSHSNDISIYGTLRKDKYFQSASALSSPCMTRRRKSLQNPYSSADISKLCSDADDISNDELSKLSSLTEQNRKLSLYGTLRPKHLSQQCKAQSQILLSTDDGYQLLYNERPKKDINLETRHGSLGTLSSSGSKASSELNVSFKENTIKDYEKLLLSDPKNISVADSIYHPPRDKASSTVKKIISEKGNRRVSFSSDVKASKSEYHTSIRQNSLNKVREANEELLSTSNHKSNTYEEEQDSGSLLEALKTYGYRGIMSQKLQSNTDKYEPRLNYRLPTECFLSAGMCNTDWDNFEYIPLDNTFTYQQAMYSPIDPTMEYYPSKTFIRNSQMKRNIAPLSCDDDITFNDILRSHRLSEEDFFSPRKPTHKFSDRSDVQLTQREMYAGETWDTNLVSSVRKKSFDSAGVSLSNERRNSGSDKILKKEREREKDGLGSTDVSESRVSKQTENSIEILSEKIQALKSRCQRKSSDENKLKKDSEDSGSLANETQGNERKPCSEAENERLQSYADSVDDLTAQEGESSESVSDRIWRKSFYSRFNDVSTTRRKKSSLMDSEQLLSGYNFHRNTGKFNVDEEGGVEEPWINTTLKRRNSRRSVPKQTMVRASSLNSDASASSECPSVYSKRGTTSTDTEHKVSRVTDRKKSPGQSNGEQNKSAIFDKTTFHPLKDELGNITKVGKNKASTLQNLDSCDTKENITGSAGNKIGTNEILNNDNTDERNPTSSHPAEKAENPGGKLDEATCLPKGTDNISETDMKECGTVTNDPNISKVSAAEEQNETSFREDFSSSSEKSKPMSELISDKHKDKATDSSSTNAIGTQDHKSETDKE